jgi:hypothetical protein
MNSFNKTQHFLLRQWERCIDDIELNKILRHIPSSFKTKTHVFISKTWLQQLNIKAKPYATLVIVVEKRNTLVTLFVVDDFWAYFRLNALKASHFIQKNYHLKPEVKCV